MPIGVYITLNSVGIEVGPTVDLFSDVDGYTTPFETDVLVSVLETGYWFNTVPTGTSIIKIQSQGDCINHIFVNISGLPGCDDNFCSVSCCQFVLINNSGSLKSWSYYDCDGAFETGIYGNGDTVAFCANQSAGPIFVDNGCNLILIGCCNFCECYVLTNSNQTFTVQFTDCFGNMEQQVASYNGFEYVVSYCGDYPTLINGTYDNLINLGDCNWNGLSYTCPE